MKRVGRWLAYLWLIWGFGSAAFVVSVIVSFAASLFLLRLVVNPSPTVDLADPPGLGIAFLATCVPCSLVLALIAAIVTAVRLWLMFFKRKDSA
jgi:hypothetical protein